VSWGSSGPEAERRHVSISTRRLLHEELGLDFRFSQFVSAGGRRGRRAAQQREDMTL